MRWKVPPRNDAEWARNTESRMSRLESASTSMRIGQWVLADRNGSLVAVNTFDGRTFLLTTEQAAQTLTFTSVTDAIEAATSITRFTRTVKVKLTGWVTGGTFTLTIEGTTSDPIAYNASAEELKAVLAAMPNYSASDFVVSGNKGGPWTVSFPGVNISGDNSLLEYFLLFEGDVVIT